MTKDSQAMVSDGEILDLLPDGNYKIKIHGADFEVKAYKGGKMKKNHIKLLPGDRVQVELNPYEITKGRIIYRYKKNPYEGGGNELASHQVGATSGTGSTKTETNRSTVTKKGDTKK